MVGSLLSRNLAGRCCFNSHKYFSLIKFIFVYLILTIFPCVHAFLALFTNLASRKLAETAAFVTDIYCLSYHHLHNMKLSESCSNRHIHHQCHQYFFWKFSIFLNNNLHNCWQPERGFTTQINLHCDHQHWQKYWNCHASSYHNQHCLYCSVLKLS